MNERIDKPGPDPDYRADTPIARRAYEYWEQRGHPFGSPETDWLRAVTEINREMTRASRTAVHLK